MVRQDLPVAQQIVQAAHAAYEAGSRFGDPEAPPPNLVLIGVSDEPRLIDEYTRLMAASIPLTLFTEPDLGDAATALSTGPITGDQRRLFKRHTLWQSRPQ